MKKNQSPPAYDPQYIESTAQAVFAHREYERRAVEHQVVMIAVKIDELTNLQASAGSELLRALPETVTWQKATPLNRDSRDAASCPLFHPLR